MRKNPAVTLGAVVLIGLLLHFGLWEVYSRRAEMKARRRAASAAAARNDGPVEAPSPGDVQGPPLPPPPTAPTVTSEKDAQVDHLLRGIDWAEYGGALLAYKQGNHDPRTNDALARGNQALAKVAQLLGIEDLAEALYDERVAPLYWRGWMKALGVTLSPEQEQRLDDLARSDARARQLGERPAKDASRLERLAWEAEQRLRWDDWVERVLTPDQFAQYTKPCGADPFWGSEASRVVVRLDDAAAAAKQVEDYWASSFGLDEASRTTVSAAAQGFVRDCAQLFQNLQARNPVGASRNEQERLQILMLRLQVITEKDLGQKLRLTPQQQGLFAQGSGSILEVGAP